MIAKMNPKEKLGGIIAVLSVLFLTIRDCLSLTGLRRGISTVITIVIIVVIIVAGAAVVIVLVVAPGAPSSTTVIYPP